jgi:hypothetical protein
MPELAGQTKKIMLSVKSGTFGTLALILLGVPA